MSSSNYYSESRTRQGTGDVFDTSNNRRIQVPINQSSNTFDSGLGGGNSLNEQRAQNRTFHSNTAIQWVNDPATGAERFRVTVNIDGFRPDEVNIRVEGNKLIVFGEHKENKNQGSAKKTIEKSFELPHDVDAHSPKVTHLQPSTMQIDFPSRHANAIIDDGRNSSGIVSDYDVSRRPAPKLTHERSATEYTSTRKLGGGDREGSSSPRVLHTYQEPSSGSRGNTYSSTSDQYQSSEYQTPTRRVVINSSEPFTTYTSSVSPRITTRIDSTRPRSPAYTFSVTGGDPQTRSSIPSTARSGSVQEQHFSETRRESHHRRSSPTTGEQSSHEVEHQRSGSPSLRVDEDRFRPSRVEVDRFHPTRIDENRSRPLRVEEDRSQPSRVDEDRFRSSASLGQSPSTSRNVEVREYSRRVGAGGTATEPLFSGGFNSDAFYRSAFRPQIFTDDRGQRRIEMKLDVHNYEPNEIKVSMNGNDLIVQAEHSTERPPTSSTRAYFYKQTSLPANTDLASLSSQYYPTEGQLHISAALLEEKSALRYN